MPKTITIQIDDEKPLVINCRHIEMKLDNDVQRTFINNEPYFYAGNRTVNIFALLERQSDDK